MKLVRALFAVPAIPATVLAASTPPFAGTSPAGLIQWYLSWFVFLYLFALGFSLMIAFPTFLLLLKIGWVRWWSVVPAGTLVGASVPMLMRLPGLPGAMELIRFASLGALSAGVFWLAWRNPERR